MNIKSIFNKSKFSFVLAIISLILYLLILQDILFDSISLRIKYYILYFIPCLIFILITIFTNKFYDKKYTKIISNLVTGLFIFFCTIYIFMLMFMESVQLILNPVTNVNRYKKIYNNYSSFIKGIFPEKIENAENTRFYYTPSMLQAGSKIILYYTTGETEINNYINKFDSIAIWKGTINDERDEFKYYFHDFFPNTPYENGLTNSFKIYSIDSECDDSGWCNHGQYIIVAINDDTNEIIFKAEDW